MIRSRIPVAIALLILLVSAVSPPVLADHGNAAVVFESTWQRTDLPVASGEAARTWIWGPNPVTEIIHEPYVESEGGERSVQYYDKARMEVTLTGADQDSIWYVTNGLLVVELMTGRLQVGDDSFETRLPAEVNVAGDAADPFGPTYRTMSLVMDEPPSAPGDVVDQRISRSGIISIDVALDDQAVTIAAVADQTGHAIARPFWDFMNSTGVVYADGNYVQGSLFENPYFATGLPVTEPYWTNAQVGGETMLVLLQCFERRCLTYTPDNAPDWRVEAGNVGLHYRFWRYESDSQPQPPPDCEPGQGADYAAAELRQPTFISQNLACANFTGSTVTQGNFAEADLRRADFSQSILTQPVFRNTTLDNAVFQSAMLDQPIFDGASVINADFDDATLVLPVFFGANLLGAEMQSAEFVMPRFVNTTCPDSTNSDDNGGTCLNNLEPIPPPVP
ncbi:MAG: pentapeptide repeat-containing protein [Thermomicrobiales bacterium]